MPLVGFIALGGISVCAEVDKTGGGSVIVAASSATDGETLGVGVSRTAKSAADVPSDSGLATPGAAAFLAATALCLVPLSLRGESGEPISPTGNGIIGFTGAPAAFGDDVRPPVCVGLPGASAAVLEAESRTVGPVCGNASR